MLAHSLIQSWVLVSARPMRAFPRPHTFRLKLQSRNSTGVLKVGARGLKSCQIALAHLGKVSLFLEKASPIRIRAFSSRMGPLSNPVGRSLSSPLWLALTGTQASDRIPRSGRQHI